MPIVEFVVGSSSLTGPSAFLDDLGRTVISLLDYRVIALVALTAVAAVAITKKVRQGQWLSLGDCIRTAAAVFTIFSGVLILCAFVFTKPPALDALSKDSLGYIGTVVTIVTFVEGSREIKRLVWGPPAPSRD
jgi:hypothetical protein